MRHGEQEITKENARAGVNTKENSVCREGTMCSSLSLVRGRGEGEEGGRERKEEEVMKTEGRGESVRKRNSCYTQKAF